MNGPWTEEEKARLKHEIETLRLTASEIALRHDRTRNSILGKAHKLGIIWGRSEEELSQILRIKGAGRKARGIAKRKRAAARRLKETQNG